MGSFRTRSILASTLLGLLFAVHAHADANGPQADDEVVDLDDIPLRNFVDTRFRDLSSAGIGHVHRKGEWMVGYEIAAMFMSGSLDDDKELSRMELLALYPVAAEKMTKTVHMLHFMAAPSDHITLLMMFRLIDISMDHRTRDGVRFTTESAGLGDVELSALINLLTNQRHNLHFSPGISIPSGSVHRDDETPMGDETPLPYPMQLGSGTFDVLPKITYRVLVRNMAIGAQVGGVIRLGENQHHYRFGNRLAANSWLSYSPISWFTGYFRLEGKWWGNIKGEDHELDPLLVQTADPQRQAGQSYGLGIGLAYNGERDTALEGFRFDVVATVPLYQRLDGPQLRQRWQLNSGVKYVWGSW